MSDDPGTIALGLFSESLGYSRRVRCDALGLPPPSHSQMFFFLRSDFGCGKINLRTYLASMSQLAGFV